MYDYTRLCIYIYIIIIIITLQPKHISLILPLKLMLSLAELERLVCIMGINTLHFIIKHSLTFILNHYFRPSVQYCSDTFFERHYYSHVLA